MTRLIVSLLAQADSNYITHYIAFKAGHTVAARYLASFDKLYARLTKYPRSGAPRPLLGPHVRIGTVSPYIVIYDYDPSDDLVTIFRIVHGRRKITGKFLLMSDERR
jgi:toxin ParE1/3/4